MSSQYISIRRPGCILFEYDPVRQLIRIKRGETMHLVDLETEAAGAEKRPFTKDEAVAAVKKVVR